MCEVSEKKHTMWLQPPFFSIGVRHLGHCLAFLARYATVLSFSFFFHDRSMTHGSGSCGSSEHSKQNLCPQLHSHDNSFMGVELAAINNVQAGAGQMLSSLLCYRIEWIEKTLNLKKKKMYEVFGMIETLLTFTNELSTKRRYRDFTLSLRMIRSMNSSSRLVRHLCSAHWMSATPSLIIFCSIYCLQQSLQNRWPHPMSCVFYWRHQSWWSVNTKWFEIIKICFLINYMERICYQIAQKKKHSSRGSNLPMSEASQNKCHIQRCGCVFACSYETDLQPSQNHKTGQQISQRNVRANGFYPNHKCASRVKSFYPASANEKCW